MSNPQAENDLFVFNFPQAFCPQTLEDKYMIFLKNLHKSYGTVIDYINSNINDITIPALTFPTTGQKISFGKEKKYRGSSSPYDVYNREFIVNMKSVDSHLLYFILQDVLMYHYTNDDIYIDDFTAIFLDEQRREMFKSTVKEIVPTGQSDIRLGNQLKTITNTTFTLSFAFNKIDTQLIPRYENPTPEGDIIEPYSDRIIPNDDNIIKPS